MQSVGKFEFSRKDLIGHGAFAVVYKGRRKEKWDWEVAVKCIHKRNLGKAKYLLAKEINILKELKHENIVGLHDYQEFEDAVYLVMEYCNGGDLSEYLQSNGILSEDTIRVFLQQMVQAMKVLQSKGIIHRDLKPQNILLSYPEGCRSNSINITFKIADFGFARYLQINTMAATLCGSPMYMAPEVIMSRSYNAKADLWSLGTIVYQCLTGKAPFHASSPHKLRLFYESHKILLPSIPKQTSDNLRHLLLGLLQRNHKHRLGFEEFFQHPFLGTCSSTKKCSSAPMLSSGSSSSSSSTSQLASPQHSKGEMHRFQPKLPYNPAQNSPGFLQKERANQDNRNIQSFTEDYVMVNLELPIQIIEHQSSDEYTCEVALAVPLESSMTYSGNSLLAEGGTGPTHMLPPLPKPVSKPSEIVGSNCSPSVPIPVPTQIQAYQRMGQNLQSVSLDVSTRDTLCCACGRSGIYPQYEEYRAPNRGIALNLGGGRPQQSSPPVGMSPKMSEQTLPLSTKTGLLTGSPDMQASPKLQVQSRMPNRTRTVPNLQSLDPASQANLSRKSAIKKGLSKRSLSTGRLSEILLKMALEAQLLEDEREESLSSKKSMDSTAPPPGWHGVFQCSDRPSPTIFTLGSPSLENSPPGTRLSRRFSDCSNYTKPGRLLHNLRKGSRRNSDTEAIGANRNSGLVFHPPELPADTLMEQPHTDVLSDLQFTLALVLCVMEMASSKHAGLDPCSSDDVSDASFLEQSLVTDQISLLSKEWHYAEQLVLYMKAEEFLSTALHSAKDNIKQGQLFPSTTVKNVVKKLNELYKNCVMYCRSLSNQLQTFLLNKQKLIDNFSALTAEKLIYSHAVNMVQSAALDEMFHCGVMSVQRYHKALVLMEGLLRTLTGQEDIDSIKKCKQCIERRLTTLHAQQYSRLPRLYP